MNEIFHDPSAGILHRMYTEYICESLLSQHIRFITRFEFMTGFVADIVAFPEEPYIIEVLDTEVEDNLLKKKIPNELRKNLLWVKA